MYQALRITPTFGFILLGLMLAIILMSLGFWQISRGHEKQRLISHIDAQSLSPLTSVNGLSQDDIGASLSVVGRFDNRHAVLLDNQTFEGRVGYRLFVPFQPRDSESWILADLGWLPASARREQLPVIPELPQKPQLKGTLDLPSARWVLGEQIYSAQSPYRVQSIDIEAIKAHLDMSLLPFVVRVAHLRGTQPLTWQFRQTWQAVVLLPQKHFGYAVQWFAMAFALCIALVFWRNREVK